MCASCFARCLLCVPPVLPGASCVCFLHCTDVYGTCLHCPDIKLAQTRMVLQLIGSGPLLMIHPHFPLKDSKVTPGRGVGNVAWRIRSSLQRVMDGHVHEKPFGAKKVQFTKKAGKKSIDAAPSVELKKDNDGYFVVDGKDFVIAPAEKTGRVMLMEDRAGTLVTTLQVLLSLSVPPVSIAVSCLSCLRPPPPLAVHLLFVAPECTDICVVPVLPPPPPPLLCTCCL